MEDRKLDITCNDGCGIIRFDYFDEDFLAVSYYQDAFYSDGIFSIILKRLKMAFYALTGKEFLMYEAILYKEDIDKFKEKMAKFIADE